MKKFWLPVFFLVIAASLSLDCGSTFLGGSLSGRQLQSISIQATENGEEFEFTATGTFSAPPTKVTPLPVDWTLGLMAPPPATYNYTLTTQPYLFTCTTSGPVVVVAFAPPNPNAPNSGSTTSVVTGNTVINCP
jgi:hypothetical protein